GGGAVREFLRRHPAMPAGLLFSAALLLAPVLTGRGTQNDLWNMAFYVVLASAWNLLGGFAGPVSLGDPAFVGIGAYTTVLLANAGWSPWLTLPVSAALAVAFSVVVGLPTFRLRGPYFTIATIGVGEAVRVIASGLEFTGGSSGLRMPAGNLYLPAPHHPTGGVCPPARGPAALR